MRTGKTPSGVAFSFQGEQDHETRAHSAKLLSSGQDELAQNFRCNSGLTRPREFPALAYPPGGQLVAIGE